MLIAATVDTCTVKYSHDLRPKSDRMQATGTVVPVDEAGTVRYQEGRAKVSDNTSKKGKENQNVSKSVVLYFKRRTNIKMQI